MKALERMLDTSNHIACFGPQNQPMVAIPMNDYRLVQYGIFLTPEEHQDLLDAKKQLMMMRESVQTGELSSEWVKHNVVGGSAKHVD